MIKAIIICGVICAAVIALILTKPEIKIKKITLGTYWLAALLGAIVLFATGCVSFGEFGAELIANTPVNPLKILVLFLSMTVMSVFLDSVGFFKYFANLALKKAGNNQFLLFLWLYLIVSVLTIFTSNDIIVLTFTPFICYFSKNADIDPVPYLVTEFVAANTWSMLLIIGNPTNIYLATSMGVGFLQYTAKMAIPALFAGIASFGVLVLLFWKKLKKPMLNKTVSEENYIQDKPLVIIGVVHLLACLLLLVISSYINLEMWYICLGFAVSLFLCAFIYKLVKKQPKKPLLKCIGGAPWQLVPFVLSMFVVVLALKTNGLTEIFANFLGNRLTVLTYGVSSFLAANVINNIPMSVLYSSILEFCDISVRMPSIYAAVIGSNIGAFLSPIGALAGIMFNSLISSHDVKFGFGKFIKYGSAVSLPTLFAALGGLMLVFLF